MELVHTVAQLKKVIEHRKELGDLIGFVPTMGALHEGHLSLVNRAGSECNFVVVSIFVNPTQFNNKEDLEKYPRTLNADIQLLEGTPCELIFAPEVNDMYPEEDKRIFEFGGIGEVMEGKHRPGHFNGVAQIVSKLFDFVKPNKAYFGLKDFQQLVIIKKITEQLHLDIEIVPCDIIRESDGLAMSSRNIRLNAEERKNAVLISKTLFEAVERAKKYSVIEVKEWVGSKINANPFLELEYFDIVDDIKLESILVWDDKINKIGCIAVNCGKVRLIDNVTFSK